MPVPGRPAVARTPPEPTVTFAPLGPIDSEAPVFVILARRPGRSEKVLRKRKDMVAETMRKFVFCWKEFCPARMQLALLILFSESALSFCERLNVDVTIALIQG